MHAYAIQPSPGLVKLDAMENPLPSARGAAGASWASGWAAWRSTAIRASASTTTCAALAAHASMPDGCELMLGNGSDELISLLAMACDVPGASILAPVPGFVMYEMGARCRG